jgi:flagellar basal body-associated protein FliL
MAITSRAVKGNAVSKEKRIILIAQIIVIAQAMVVVRGMAAMIVRTNQKEAVTEIPAVKVNSH